MEIKAILLYFGVCFVSVGYGKLFTNFRPGNDAVRNEFIIELNSDAVKAKRDFVSRARILSVFDVKEVTKVGKNAVFLVATKEDILPEGLVQHLKDKFRDVIYVSRNFIMKSNSTMSKYECSDQPGEAACQSHDTLNNQWGLSRISNEDMPRDRSQRRYTWSDTNDGDGVTIYVVDSGVKIEHEEFSEINAQSGFTIPILRFSEGDGDLNGHGTHVAGIAAGRTYGVAKKARIVSVKVQDWEGAGTTFRVLKGLEFILQDFMKNFERTGVRPKAVVNLSLGGPKDENIDQAIAEGSAMGLIYVAAAGNEAQDACNGSPSSSPDAITVGATDEADSVAWFSNYGKCVDILAPGVDIMSAGIDSNRATLSLDGTSMAAPFVAGVIARLLSHSKEASDVTCVREHLLKTAITGHVKTRLGRSMPDRILYGGCNTCFDDAECTSHYSVHSSDNGANHLLAAGSTIYCLSFALVMLANFYQ